MQSWSLCSKASSNNQSVEAEPKHPSPFIQPPMFENPAPEVASGSHFAVLLHQAALEHDREISYLQAVISRLTGKEGQDFTLGSACSDVAVIASQASAPGVFSFENLDDVPAQEREPVVATAGNWFVRPSGEHERRESTVSRGSLSKEVCDALGAALIESEHELEEDHSPRENRSLRTSLRSVPEDEAVNSHQSDHIRGEEDGKDSRLLSFRTSASNLECEEGALGSWQRIIKFVKDTNTQFVKLDSTWHEQLERKVQKDNEDVKAVYSVVMDMVVAMSNTETPRMDFMSKTSYQSNRSRSRLSELTEARSRRTYVVENLERASLFCVIHPASRFRIIWDILGMLLLINDLTLIPLQVFDGGTNGMGHDYDVFLHYLDMFAIIFWTLDIFISFLTGYYSAEGFVEIHHIQIAKNYLRSWFLLDVMIVSVDWISMALNLKSEVGYLRLGKTASRFMRIIRLLRLMKMNEQFSKLMEQIDSEYTLTVVGVSKLLLGMIFANHYIACGWYALTVANLERTWFGIYLGDKEQMDVGYVYLTSMHWSLTQFTPASMDIHPTNSWERLYAIVTIIAAMVTFSSFVSSITGAMTHIRALNEKKSAEDAKVRQYFSMNKISFELACQVWHFRRRNMMTIKSRIKEADFPGFNFLPGRMREQLRLEVYAPILRQHPLFALYMNLCPEGISQVCFEAMGECRLLSGEEIMDFRKRITQMLFVVDGVLEYHSGEFFRRKEKDHQKITREASRSGGSFLEETSSRSLKQRRTMAKSSFQIDLKHIYERFQVNKGEWACEIALWSDMGKTSGPFVGGYTGCELVFLYADQFRDIVRSHTEGAGAAFVAKYSEMFIQRFNSAYADTSCTNVLFNDFDNVREMVHEAMLDLDSGASAPNGHGDGQPKRLSARLRAALHGRVSHHATVPGHGGRASSFGGSLRQSMRHGNPEAAVIANQSQHRE